MSKKSMTLLFSVFISLSFVFGQQKDSIQLAIKPVIDLAQVMVTANKIEQKQNNTGKVISIITAAQIASSSGNSIAQILSSQAGISLPGSESNIGTVPSVYMRGAASGRTLILIDGAPVGDPSMISNEFDLNLIPIQQVERIEILKGAQSTLYGSDAIGGVINIITKNANKKSFTVGLSAGSFGTKNANVQYNNKIGDVKYSVGVEKQSTTGISSAMDANNSGLFDKDGYENTSWFLKIQKDLNNNWSLNMSTKKTAYEAAIDYGAFKDDRDAKFKNATQLSGFTLKHQKEKTIFQFQYQFTTQDRTYRNDSVDKKYIVFENNVYAGKSHYADAFGSIPLSKNIQIIVGTDFRYGSYHQDYFSISVYGPYTDKFKDTFQFQNALYTSILINSTNKKWLFEFGSRYNNQSRYGSNVTYTMSPSYKINDRLRFLGSLSTGFKAPSLYQLSYNVNLKPEQSINTELGAEYKTKTVYTRIVYYNRNINNGIDYNYIDYNFFNFIKQKVNGFEVELTHAVTEKSNITANYTLLNGSETNQNRVTNLDTLTYPYLLKRPKQVLQLQWNYSPNSNWDVNLSGRWVSARYDVGGYGSADIKLKGYSLVNAHVQYLVSKNMTLFINAQNLLNTPYQEINGYNTLGRNFLAGIRIH